MYGGYGGGMYGRSMYGGYGGGMYGGYGGYGGGMYGGMYPGMMGQGMGSSYAESMWRMTQMLEMNSIMLEQLQEHVTVTFYRLRDVVEWIWALKNSSDSLKDKPPEEECKKEEQDLEMKKIRNRFKALLILLGVFLFLIFRDNRRQKKRLLDESSWLKVTKHLAIPEAAASMAPAMGGGPMVPWTWSLKRKREVFPLIKRIGLVKRMWSWSHGHVKRKGNTYS